jgi:hypothetical protein
MDVLLSLPTDDQFRTKLNTARRLCENGVEGDLHFVQVSHCPVTSLYLITGPLREDSNTVHQTNMRLVAQPDNFPEFPRTMYSSQQKGYKYHLEKCRDAYELDNSVGFNPLDFQTYRETFMNICGHIDTVLHQYHGIKCYNDGNLNNNMFSNMFFMHVCGVLNILKCETKGQAMPLVFVLTPMMEVVLSEWRNVLVHSMLTEYELHFLIKEIDYFYTCYAYFGNYSMLPIRTQVSEDCDVFVRSSFFTNNDHFVEHQMGKMKELNQNHTHVPTMIVMCS